MTPTEARERVAKGAAHLDQVRPGWERRIDTGTLTLHDPCGCIVGQLCDADYRHGLLLLDVETDASRRLGFDLEAAAFDGEHDEPWFDAQYILLQDAWIEAIAARLHPQSEEVEAEVLARVVSQ